MIVASLPGLRVLAVKPVRGRIHGRIRGRTHRERIANHGPGGRVRSGRALVTYAPYGVGESVLVAFGLANANGGQEARSAALVYHHSPVGDDKRTARENSQGGRAPTGGESLASGLVIWRMG
jgi:hypothetical protein